ncbi:Fatty acyl-CoA reductase wat [Fusarium oxysporum f. sp. raphani]|uniref:Fatty acyl-CoA reductase n=1 Tax=Fusarium oxysporum f. sp. raphani TaxID=96318 RepID=A0A8J5UCC5_FUSOX|nr:Fatty acyl-CoA reductase wat [Fusarium oxysporum f. sp. raphani]
MSSHKVVLVTGATGFLGKVVVEELLRLRAAHDIQQVILLIRKKDSFNAKTRFAQQISSSPCFSLLPKSWVEYIQVMDADLACFRCGLGDNEYGQVCEAVTHIIHTAACIKFDSEVSDAISSNIDSSRNVLSLAKDCDKLQQLVVTSTAYVTPPQEAPIYESLVDLPRPASRLINELKTGVVGKQQAIAATGHPNIYSLSKCLAEHLICETKGSLPVTIVRPSIICAALEHPMPGWIDSKAAFGGLVLGFGSGVLRVIDGRPNAKLDIVPVDVVAGYLIREAFRISCEDIERPNTRIVFSVATKERSLTLREACRLLERFFKESFRYIGPQGHVLQFYQFLHHYFPLHLYAVTNRLKGNMTREKAAKRSWRIVSGMNAVFSPYTKYTYDFRPLEPPPSFDPDEYIRTVCSGVQRNLMQSKL